jgi:hypothetical protein
MFRFTFREFALLTALLAFATCWYVDREQLKAATKKNQMLREALQSTLYDYEETTGDRIGIQLPDGEFLQSQEQKGMLLRGSG